MGESVSDNRDATHFALLHSARLNARANNHSPHSLNQGRWGLISVLGIKSLGPGEISMQRAGGHAPGYHTQGRSP
jgi:hypothetical protein